MFNEPEFLKLLFLLSDTQQWLDDMSCQLFTSLPITQKRKFLRKTYFLSVRALAHILERHHYKIPRYPGVGKFHIPLADLLQHIRDAHVLPVSPVTGKTTFQRCFKTSHPIGFDKQNQLTDKITILTDAGGNIITAFPGIYVQKDLSPYLHGDSPS